jgi:hypothetical protein
VNDRPINKLVSTNPPEPVPGSLKYEPTGAQYHGSPILAACYKAGFTEGQTIEMLFREYQRLMRDHMRLVELKPAPMRFVTEKP